MFKNSLSIFLIASFVMLSACTQKRDPLFAQGQGSNLDSIETWSEKYVELETGEIIGTPSTTNAQNGVVISKDVKSMNHFELVQLKVSDANFKTLIGNPPFRGIPNTKGTYQAQIKLTDDYLMISKVAKKEDLPFEEHFYISETLKDGRVTIPLLGYKIKGFFRIENEKTGDDQDTHHLVEIETDDQAQASHVRIDWSSRQVFEPIKKLDLFPAEIFFTQNADTHEFKPYEWYYSETITEKSLSDSATIVGENNTRDEKSKLSSASKIIFLPRENELRVVSVARDERLSRDQIRHSADLNSEAALILPVKWKDYGIKEQGADRGLMGEEHTDRKWNQRRYFEANFLELQSTAIAEGKTSLLDIQIDQNYMSFTVMNMVGNKGRKIHYSFLRADQGRAAYQSKISTQQDRNTFGFFTTVKPYVNNWEYYTNDDYRKRMYMNRMNPAQKEITFHLSAESPKWLEDVAEQSIKAWDKTFEDALGKDKLKINFSRDRVTLGDLRYNVIHLVDSLNEDGLLGFGPSVADPETGEIISASTNVYVSSIQSIAANSIRQYIIERLEGRTQKDSGSALPILSEVAAVNTTPVLGTKKALQDFSEMKNGQVDFKKLSKAQTSQQVEPTQMTDTLSRHQCSYAQQAALSASDRDIQKYCPEIEAIVSAQSGISFADDRSEKNWEKVWDSSKDAIRECSQKITRGKLLSTLIHEIGHNFGLRHNFYGSLDKANFKKMHTIFGDTVTANSSSIMEYTDWDEDRLTEAGNYDIAAIRFGYGNAVELKDGTQINVGNASIDSTLSTKQKAELKPYLFCTDEEAYSGLNALCRPHDAGTNPKEIVEFFIKQYKRNETLRQFRRARPNTASEVMIGNINFSNTFTPLRQIYDQWRLHLGEYVKKSNRYLVDYNSKSYQAALESMKTDTQFGPVYEQYYEASQLIYSFLKDVAFGTDQYCLIEDSGSTHAIEFVSLRDQLFEATRGTMNIRNCAEAQSASEFAKILETKAPKVVSQVGYPAHSYRFTKYENLSDLSDDVLGNESTRMMAFMAITMRLSNAQTVLNTFSPSMMDEPAIFEDLVSSLLKRVMDGVDLSAYGVKEHQPLFTSESEIWSTSANLLNYGIRVPGDLPDTYNTTATLARKRMFTVYSPQQSDDPAELAAVLKINGRMTYAALSKDQTLAYNLIQQYKKVERDLKATSLSDADQASALASLKALLPTATNLSSYSLKKFVVLYNTLIELNKKSGGLIVCIQSKVPAMNQIDSAVEQLMPMYTKANEQGEEAVEKLLASDLTAFTQAVLKQDVTFTLEGLTGLDESAKTCANEQNVTALTSKRYKKDLESQKSLILEILGIYAE